MLYISRALRAVRRRAGAWDASRTRRLPLAARPHGPPTGPMPPAEAPRPARFAPRPARDRIVLEEI